MPKSKRYWPGAGSFLCTFVVFGVLSSAKSAEAVTYYVAKTGSDANSCAQSQSPNTAKLTIGAGLACLASGDTLRIGPGTYAGHLRNNIPSGGGGWAAATTVKADNPNDRPIIRPADNGNFVFVLSSTPKSYIILDGLILDATGCATDLAVVKLTDGANHIRIIRSVIRNQHSGHGILINDGKGVSDYNEIISTEVHANGFPHTSSDEHGIYIQTSNNLVEKSRIYDNWGWGIHQFSGSNANNVYRNNVFYSGPNNAGGSGGKTQQDGILMRDGPNGLASNNLVYNCGGGILAGPTDAPHGGKVYNNTVVGCGSGVHVQTGGVDIDVRNNILYNNATNFINNGTNTTSSNNLTTNPSFVSAANDDYHLQSVSAAINAGVTLSDVPDDFAGNPRPQGPAYDIGAYEATAADGTAPSPPRNLRVQ